jgi:hypothetical protein
MSSKMAVASLGEGGRRTFSRSKSSTPGMPLCRENRSRGLHLEYDQLGKTRQEITLAQCDLACCPGADCSKGILLVLLERLTVKEGHHLPAAIAIEEPRPVTECHQPMESGAGHRATGHVPAYHDQIRVQGIHLGECRLERGKITVHVVECCEAQLVVAPYLTPTVRSLSSGPGQSGATAFLPFGPISSVTRSSLAISPQPFEDGAGVSDVTHDDVAMDLHAALLRIQSSSHSVIKVPLGWISIWRSWPSPAWTNL